MILLDTCCESLDWKSRPRCCLDMFEAKTLSHVAVLTAVFFAAVIGGPVAAGSGAAPYVAEAARDQVWSSEEVFLF